MSTPFIGRKSQLNILQEVNGSSRRSRITAIYGRRRIGKTRLVREAYAGLPVLCFEGLEGSGSSEQKRHFLKTLERHTGRAAHRLASASDWEDLLILLAEHVAAEPGVIFFDEFQWMAAGRNDLISKLKYVWDNHFAQIDGVHLILCGSVSSFLVKKVIRSKALYGRIDRIIHLGPLDFGEVRQGFFPSRGVLEALEYYLLFGGVPKYLELIDTGRSVRLNLIEACFKPDAFYLNEFERIFISHFGKVRYYSSIVEFLSERGFASRKEIAKHLGLNSGGSISELIENLVLAGFIESYGSIRNPNAGRLKRYRVTDPFLLFYFKFIQPIGQRIARSTGAIPLAQALPDNKYESFLGYAFERFCRQHAHIIAERLGFSAVAYDHGSWFKRGDSTPGGQIDLLFIRADKVITLCEAKFTRKVTSKIIPEVERKVEVLRATTPYSIEKVLISALPPSREVYESGYFSKILTAEDFAGST